MVLDKKILGNRIKEARRIKSQKLEKRYTGDMLAADIKISRSYLGDMESGRIYPSYVLLSRIAEACEVPLAFFGDMDEVLDNVIKQQLPDMDEPQRKDLVSYLNNMLQNTPANADPDLEVIKRLCDDYNRSALIDLPQDHPKNDKITDNNESLPPENHIPLDFDNAEDALKFILEQPTLMAYGGYDLKQLSDDEIIEIANDMLFAMRLSLEKINKKKKR